MSELKWRFNQLMIGLSVHWSLSVTKILMAAPLMPYGRLLYDDLMDCMLVTCMDELVVKGLSAI